MTSPEPPEASSRPLRAGGPTAAHPLLVSLNEVQRRAVVHDRGPLVVFAGAGSGKTRIITHRVAWLIEQGVKPWEILAVTFTNKAAGEMRDRIAALTPLAGRCLIATFHSACARWLREFAAELGFTADFTVYDDQDALAAIKTVLAELNVRLDDQTTAQEFKAAINRAKTMALLPSDEALRREDGAILPAGGLAVYERYQEYLASCNAMDFGDLIMNMLLLLRRNTRVRELLQRRYRYILVDEYQDTNRTQFELVARLADAHRNLFVVGDDDQSIYSWRGAVPANIIEFDQVYTDAVKVTLEHNYRCSGTVVAAAAAMIAHNEYRAPKTIFTKNPAGDKIVYRLEADNELEAWWVIDSIRSEAARFPWQDIAIFYRTNGQSRVLEDALRRDHIPYRIYGTVRFYDRTEVKDLLAYLRLLVNPLDDISVRRVLNVPPRGIGKKAEELLEKLAAQDGIALMAALNKLGNEGKTSRLGDFARLIDNLRRSIADVPLGDVLEKIVHATGYIEYIRKRFPEQAADKIDNIHELGAALADHAAAYPESTVADWLRAVTLSSEEEGGAGGVTMMTLHMAKGLEFRRVYIVGVEEGLLPHHNSLDDQASREEERRLLYVGMTRAKEKLSLTSVYRRRTYNNWAMNRPSRFLSEIPPELFAPISAAEEGRLREMAGDYSYDDEEPRYEYEASGAATPALQVGATVHHPTYGRGVVEELVEEFGLEKAIVRFEEFGLRKVMGHHLR